MPHVIKGVVILDFRKPFWVTALDKFVPIDWLEMQFSMPFMAVKLGCAFNVWYS